MLNLPLDLPSFYWQRSKNSQDPKLKDWIIQYEGHNQDISSTVWDILLFGVPLSRSSISVSGASEFPDFFRRAWKGFSTYNLDYDTELNELNVLDIGDVQMHFTDISKSHANIKETMKGIKEEFPRSLPVAIGGDHSITAMLVSGMKEAFPEQRIGIIQFDTHLDLRDLQDHGPTNGTPIRNLIEHGIVKGNHVFNIGLHGFFNGQSLLRYAHDHGLNMVSLKQARRKGITETVRLAIQELEEKVDLIYVTIDMDVLDIAFAPGVPASTPGGMRTDELFDAVYEAGKSKKLCGMDIVCLDPTKDLAAQPTVKAGVYTFLTFLTAFINR
ncbi:MAG: agmatinase family protein [Bacillota bacterium]|nr:agmatinase family protein [Bacillota bacterium]